jgi:hypothetical protein
VLVCKTIGPPRTDPRQTYFLNSLVSATVALDLREKLPVSPRGNDIGSNRDDGKGGPIASHVPDSPDVRDVVGTPACDARADLYD